MGGLRTHTRVLVHVWALPWVGERVVASNTVCSCPRDFDDACGVLSMNTASSTRYTPSPTRGACCQQRCQQQDAARESAPHRHEKSPRAALSLPLTGLCVYLGVVESALSGCGGHGAPAACSFWAPWAPVHAPRTRGPGDRGRGQRPKGPRAPTARVPSLDHTHYLPQA